MSWELLAAATNVAANNCIKAGYPLVPFGPKTEAAPKRSPKRIKRPQSSRKRAA